MSEQFMIKVRPATAIRTMMELPSTTLARAVDPQVYREAKKLAFVGNPRWLPLSEFRAYAFVVLQTGFESNPENSTVVYVDPKNDHLGPAKLHFTLNGESP